MTEDMADSRIYGLVGHPLGHSFSAHYFKKKFKSMPEKDSVYWNFDFSDLEKGISQLKSEGRLRGFNVTIPYKRAILAYLDEISEEAAVIGAVNTVVVEPDTRRWIGCNTDAAGFWNSLQAFMKDRLGEKNLQALVLGNGGASQAVQYALASHGIPYDLVCRPGHGPTEDAPQHFFRPRCIWNYDSLPEKTLKERISLIINATSLGMHPNPNAAPRIPYHALTASHYAFDLVYNPQETLFLRRCREQGAGICGGLGMLYSQADAAFSIWMA